MSRLCIWVFDTIPIDEIEFPSEKDALKKGVENIIVIAVFTMINVVIAIEIATIRKINHCNETLAAIPIVIAQKYTDNSNGDLTGFRKRTIESAPTMPNDSAIFPEITLVITYVMIGSITIVVV